uniref:Uncharacterized protein n=1 Tax=uncultured microorganism TaxID=358574 RepID=I2FJM8_9ZZZZ|nr:hypothetical protein [uncultured microorganism]
MIFKSINKIALSGIVQNDTIIQCRKHFATLYSLQDCLGGCQFDNLNIWKILAHNLNDRPAFWDSESLTIEF